MRISIDSSLCEAHGDCVIAAPELFDLGEEDDVVRVLDAEPGEALREKVELAVRLCPVAAIRIEG
jgi:ferredoxin